MDISMESVHVDGTKAGAVVRRRTPREVRTLAVVRDRGGLRHIETALAHPGDLRAWTTYTMRDGETHLTLTRSGDHVDVDGAGIEVPADTIPGYAATCYLEDMLAESATEAEFHRLDEEHPTEQPSPAHFSVSNPENVELPDGRHEQLGAVELFVGDTPTRRFWFDSHDIVAAEWHEGRSYRVETVDDLVDGLDADVADVVRTFCG